MQREWLLSEKFNDIFVHTIFDLGSVKQFHGWLILLVTEA